MFDQKYRFLPVKKKLKVFLLYLSNITEIILFFFSSQKISSIIYAIILQKSL